MSDNMKGLIGEMEKQIQLGHKQFCVGFHRHEDGQVEEEWISWTAALERIAATPEAGPTDDAKDAARWRYIRPFLDVDCDDFDTDIATHFAFLTADVDKVPSLEMWGASIEDIVDNAIKESKTTGRRSEGDA